MELIINNVGSAVEEVVAKERTEQSQTVVAELNALELTLVGGGVANVAF